MKLVSAIISAAIAAVSLAPLAHSQAVSLPSETPQKFTPTMVGYDHDRRSVDIPMRDGVKLHAVIVVPHNLKDAPIMLDRTPYNAESGTSRASSIHAGMIVSPAYAELLAAGYIVVVEDVRGKYGSEGDYVMNRPIKGPLNPTEVDHPTDTYDTIDWLVKNVPETNGRVGTIGVSYDGFTVTQGLINPHPALKAAVPINPMVDGWMGDDWFHNGAFRQEMLSYIYEQQATRKNTIDWPNAALDDYPMFLKAGSAGALGKAMGMEQLGFWQKITQHHAYDDWWKQQAVDKILAQQPLKVPTLWVHSLWDQEDIYGAIAAYKATEPKDTGNTMNYLVLGPWRHGGSMRGESQLGAIRFDMDPGLWFRKNVLIPWLDQRLKTNGRPADIAPVTAFDTGVNEWRRLNAWPAAGASTRALYLQPGLGLGFDAPKTNGADSYVSDPAKPVPYRVRPTKAMYSEGSTWGQWLVDDQRPFSDRPDVLVYVSEPLTEPLHVAGTPGVRLFASTSGTDSDWVVKLIDVYPDEVPGDANMGGYQLAVSMDAFRGRYRESYSEPRALKANAALEYKFSLPTANHVFRPGHRIMVQIQSSWFPLYDRNPQTFVPNIFFAEPSAYKAATQKVYFGGKQASAIDLPLAPAGR